MKKPTVQSLAAELHVSRQTVSNVLNAPHRVHPDTRRRVEEAIARSGYRPSVAARALRNQRSMSIGLRLPAVGDGINGAVMDGFLHALVEQADARGYRIVLFTARSTTDELGQVAQLRESNAIDACVLTDTFLGDARPAQLADRGVPFVAFGRPWDAPGDHAWVDVDGRAGTMAATRHLRSLGHDRIGFIGWPDESGVGADRRSGWAAALGADDDQLDDLAVATTDSVGNGAQAMRELLGRGISAVVCASDSLALGALTELRSARQGGGVVGYDDTPVARAVGLSSVRQPVIEAATAVLDLVIGQLDDEIADNPHVLLAPTLISRVVADFLS